MDKDLLLKYIENGTTLYYNLQEINKNNGFMVSIMGMEKTFDPCDLTNIEKTIIDYQKRLKTSQFIGCGNMMGLFISIYQDITQTNKTQ